jgi:anti-sigma-K factor RskA
MNYNRPELRDRLASEYVLGTLSGRARKRFQRLLKANPALREDVAAWERRLVPMASALSAPMPSAKVWMGISSAVARRSAPAAKPGFFERWFGLRSLGSLAAGIVLGIGVMLMMPLIQPGGTGSADAPLAQAYAGFLQDGTGTPTVLVSSLRHGRSVDVKLLRNIDSGAGVLQLWALPREGTPFPLGVIPSQGRARLQIPEESETLLKNVSELAVTVESRPASPGAVPTTDYILRGPCLKFW